ncbi:MAG: class I SAM-dependent methyltransferase [Phototrophicaceae bacterium]|jgi:ubiquinone/menaquinone biosynthesis C-methylase UbiE
MIGWIGVALVTLALILAIGWWLLIETEGVYLGQRVVTWLYDLYAKQYDSIKAYQPPFEHMLLARPLVEAIHPQRNPLILDSAIGTARLAFALFDHPAYRGQIIGVDISRKMLAQAATKLGEDMARVDLIHAPATRLPFPDSSFDVVVCLEALEFIDDPELALAEAMRVLRPGGILLTTRRINLKTMPGKLWSAEKMQHELERNGAVKVIPETWQEQYDLVWARKAGSSAPIGAQPLEAVLRCPRCEQVAFSYDPPLFTCGHCGQTVRVGDDGVLEFLTAQKDS